MTSEATSRIDFGDCDDFRSSLQVALNALYERQGKINFADFSRRAGFSSRSYVFEILKGRKGLSNDALHKIKSGCKKLPRPVLNFLELNAYRDFPTLRPKKFTQQYVENRLLTLRRELLNIGQQNAIPVKREVVKSSIFHRVYAGLGSTTLGASPQQIAARTGLSESIIHSALQYFVKNKFVKERDGRYYAVSNQADSFGLSEGMGLADLVADTCKFVNDHRTKIIEDRKQLVFYSAFSMNQSRALEFRQRLKEAVFEILDEFQDDDGDCVREVFLSFHKS